MSTVLRCGYSTYKDYRIVVVENGKVECRIVRYNGITEDDRDKIRSCVSLGDAIGVDARIRVLKPFRASGIDIEGMYKKAIELGITKDLAIKIEEIVGKSELTTAEKEGMIRDIAEKNNITKRIDTEFIRLVEQEIAENSYKYLILVAKITKSIRIKQYVFMNNRQELIYLTPDELSMYASQHKLNIVNGRLDRSKRHIACTRGFSSKDITIKLEELINKSQHNVINIITTINMEYIKRYHSSKIDWLKHTVKYGDICRTILYRYGNVIDII